MTDLIERIGPYLGIAAFLGLAILAFLIFQQAREVRRLREWAGRAPERADEAHGAEVAAAESAGDEPPEPEQPPEDPGMLGRAIDRVQSRSAAIWAELDRRSPFDPRYFLVVIAAGVVAAGVLTSGFGLLSGDDGGGDSGNGGEGQGAKENPEKVEVSVLNATQDDSGAVPIAGVPGLAGEIAKQVVKPAGFAIGEKADAANGLAKSVIMYDPAQDGAQESAEDLATVVVDQLGETEVQPLVDEVAELAGGAPVVLVVGQDDAATLDSVPDSG